MMTVEQELNGESEWVKTLLYTCRQMKQHYLLSDKYCGMT